MSSYPALVNALLAEILAAAPYQPATAVWRAIELAEIIRRDVLTDGAWLDLGCGDGTLCALLARRALPATVVGVDPDPEETALALIHGPYERVHTAPGHRVPEPDAAFDLVLSNSVLEHIPLGDLGAVLKETARLLKPGGRFAFTVPSVGFHAALRGPRLPGASRTAYLRRIDRRTAHLHYLSRRRWEALLAEAGLALRAAHAYLTPAQVRRWEAVSALTAGALYSLLRGRTQPIAIQRRMRLRKPHPAVPRALLRALAAVLLAGLSLHEPEGDEAQNACLLLVAEKPSR